MRERSIRSRARSLALGREARREGALLARILLFTTLLLLAASQLLAQGRRIPFDHLTTADGLSHDSVNAVVQDHSGFMWFGTQDGLTRYDGDRTVVFRNRQSDPTRLSDSWVWVLLEDSQENLWVGTDGGGLNLWDPVRRGFRRFANDEAPTGDTFIDWGGPRIWVLLAVAVSIVGAAAWALRLMPRTD